MTAGFAAASHLDLVLSKLEHVAKMDSKRSSSFLDFFKVCVECSVRMFFFVNILRVFQIFVHFHEKYDSVDKRNSV